MSIKLKSPAKINLFLKIQGIEKKTGMHFLETLMVPVNIFDTIDVEESTKFSITTKGVKESISTENNIVFKAFNAVSRYVGKSLPKFEVIIEKEIPTGAGLGGGSSNAAVFIKFLNDYMKLNLSMDKLVEIASQIGSDVPFFIYGSPAIVKGKGEIVEPVSIEQSGKFLLLLYPDIIVKTSLAYNLFDKKKLTKTSAVNINSVRKRESCSLKDWTQLIFNDFEEVVFEEWASLSQLKLALELSGAIKVFMSGSGSTLIAIYDSEEKRDKVLEEYRRKYETVRKIELLTV